MIGIPPKIWRPKLQNRYIHIDYSNDVNEGVFDFSHYGRTVFCPKIKWSDKDWDEIILFDKASDTEELIKKIYIGKIINWRYKEELTSIIQRYWIFVLQGRAILYYYIRLRIFN